MADFDSNPFADPEAGVTNTSGGRKKTTEELIDDFNPFAVDQFTNQPVPGSQHPAVIQPTPSTAPPAYEYTEYPPPASSSSSAAARSVADDLQRRQEELDRKAADIDRREREMDRNVVAFARVNNFPPLPSWFPIKPCFYQDFNLDIPQEFQSIVKTHFYLWMAYAILLFINIGGALGSLIMKTVALCGTTFALSILYFILFSPLAFICWYRPVYKAFRSDSSFNFFFYFFVFFIQFVANVIQAIGIDGSGTCGFINGIQSVTENIPVGAIMIILGTLFASCAATSMILLIRVHRLYRASGASFKKAQEEFAHGVMSNQSVQRAASNAANQAVQGAVEQTFTDVRH